MQEQKRQAAAAWAQGQVAGHRLSVVQGCNCSLYRAGLEKGVKMCGYCRPPRGRNPGLPDAPTLELIWTDDLVLLDPGFPPL